MDPRGRNPLRLLFGRLSSDFVDRQDGRVSFIHAGLLWKLVAVQDPSDADTVQICLNVEKIDPDGPLGISAVVNSTQPFSDRFFVEFRQNCNEVGMWKMEKWKIGTFRCEIVIITWSQLKAVMSLGERLEVKNFEPFDVVIVVDRHEFYMSYQLIEILANQSERFKELFEENPDQKRFEVDFISVIPFQRTLEVIYNAKSISGNNVLEVLEAAHVLRMKGKEEITFKCRRILFWLPPTQCSFESRILLAEKLGMEDLLEETRLRLKTQSELEKVCN